jgi:putative ABC transport system permease protein
VAETAAEEIARMRLVDRWIARLSIPQTAEELIAQAAGSDDPAALANLVLLGQLADGEDSELARRATGAATYLAFFRDLNYGRRRVLVGSAESTQVFDRLQQPEDFSAFTNRLAAMKTVRFTGEVDAFAAFLAEWPALRGQLERIRTGQAQAIRALQQALNGRPLMKALREADHSFGDAIRTAGFLLDPAEATALANQVGDVADRTLIEEAMLRADIRQAVAARRDILPGDVSPSLVWNSLKNGDEADWFLAQMRTHNLAEADWNRDTLTALAGSRARAVLLKEAERATSQTGGGLLGIGQRMTWLALVSMLVCAVGIANAMLMSVTERFREIATLKCLGALDGFIMTVFLIEAAILGLVGGVVGTLVGLLIATLRMAASFRGLLLNALPAETLLLASLLSITIGIVLAAFSAVYPSLRAARLAPMEAMRIE